MVTNIQNRNFVKSIFTLLVLLIFHINIFAQETKDNFSIIDSLFQQGTSDIIDFVSKQNAVKISVILNEHPASWLLLSKLEQDFSSAGILLYDEAGKDVHQLEIRLIKAGVTFENIGNTTDSLHRSITLNFSGKISNPDKAIKIFPEMSYTYTDTICREKADIVNSSEHGFARASIPPEEQTFWEEAVQPLIFVSTAAITVLLLFSVRSN